MTRRLTGLIVSLACAIGVGPLAAGPPPAGRLLRLGYVWPGSPGAYTTSLSGLRQGLRDFGYVDGQPVVIEERYTEGQMERLPDRFAEPICLKVDLLVAPGTVIAHAAQQATTTIPIVAVVGNPVGTGLAATSRGCRPCQGRGSVRPDCSCSRKPYQRSPTWPTSGIRPSPHIRPS